jgi:hypothetical protein
MVAGDSGWSLEVIDQEGASTVWDDLFATDHGAFAEFSQTLETEGILLRIELGGTDLVKRAIRSQFQHYTKTPLINIRAPNVLRIPGSTCVYPTFAFDELSYWLRAFAQRMLK